MRSMLTALSTLVFLSACAGVEKRLAVAATKEGEIRASRSMPDYPPDCRRKARSSVQEGDRLDTALLKTDAALARQNARTGRCADWYDTLKAGIEVKE